MKGGPVRFPDSEEEIYTYVIWDLPQILCLCILILANPSSICMVSEVGMFLIIDLINVGGNLNESFCVVALGAEGQEEQGEIKEKRKQEEK